MAHVKGVVGKITGQTKAWKKHDKRSAEAAHEMAKRGKKQKSFFSDTGESHGKGHRIPDNERNRKRWKKEEHATGGRAGFKHGKYVRAAVPHADIDKLIDKGTGKEDDRKGNRYRVEGSELKFKKPRKSAGPAAGRAARPTGSGVYIKIKKATGGRIGLKHGGSAGAVMGGKKVGAQIK